MRMNYSIKAEKKTVIFVKVRVCIRLTINWDKIHLRPSTTTLPANLISYRMWVAKCFDQDYPRHRLY